jgi:C_GCAxxG_C_C family probable redox protein
MLDPVAIARAYFLDERHEFGCAETTFVVLKGAFGLDDPMDSAAAMALNGGVAYSGGVCGAVTGAALALGLLAQARIDDHARAKKVARELTARLMDGFTDEHGAVGCRDLIGIDLRAPGGHAAFIASGLWRERCMRQIETVVRDAAPLADLDAWDTAVRDLDAPGA